jgi:hypothetical protein
MAMNVQSFLPVRASNPEITPLMCSLVAGAPPGRCAEPTTMTPLATMGAV